MLKYQQATNLLSAKEKIGQFFMPAAFINDNEEAILALEKLIADYHIGGLCFFHSRASAATNYEGKKKVIYNEQSFDTLKALIERYQKAAKYPLLISIDAEWGLAMRIENTPQYPYAISLGAMEGNLDLLFQMGQQIASDCQVAGIHWNLAPVADINNNPENPVIGYRSFGENKNLVAEKAIAYMKGMQEQGLLTSVKHFPGHGDTATDSHLGLPLIEKSKKELLQYELYPFQKLIDAGVDSVMAGHLSVPALANGSTSSSSISKEMLKGMLRGEMGFEGVIISDALNMHAVSKNYKTKGQLEWLAFDAGNDILCFAENTREGINTIQKNATLSQLEESFRRIWKLKEKAFSGEIKPNAALIDSSELNKKFAVECLTQHLGSPADLQTFRNEGFIGLEVTKKKERTFLNHLKSEQSFNALSTAEHSIEEIEETIKLHKNVLLALYPPKAKPQNHFEIAECELSLINALIDKKNVVLYLFGNPYVLNLIDMENLKALLIAYQDFEVFEETAARHFMESLPAKGKLPVILNKVLS